MTQSDRESRREFLRGKSAAHALAGAITAAHGRVGEMLDLPPAPHGDSPLVESERPQPLASFSRRAMACEFEIQIAAGRDGQTQQSVLDALDLLEPLEAQMTIYRTTSEVLEINRLAAEEPVKVESRLFGLLQLADRLHRKTNGALDITSGPLSEVWGFSRRQGRMPADAEIAEALERVGMGDVVLDAADESVSFRHYGLSLHLNCIGKGYALDRIAEFLTVGAVDDCLLHGGRSSVLARGRCPGGADNGWRIGLRHPVWPEVLLGEFVLRNEALGTSGSATQSFVHEGRRYGHLIDPRTGWPVESVYTATVLAPSAAEADALSTAFYIMGPDETAAYCAAHPGIAAVLVCPGEAEGNVRVLASNLDENRWLAANDV